MKKIIIPENSSYTLAEKYLPAFKEFLSTNTSLPITLNQATLSFDSYTVGSITVQDLTIVIQPRIKNLTPNHYFEMQLFNEDLLDASLSSMIGENVHFGIQQNLTQLFLEEAHHLVVRGIDGSFIKITENSNILRGRILTEKISPINLLQDLLPIEYEIHTLNTTVNKIIKLALNKVLPILSNKHQNTLHALVNSHFDEIDVLTSELPNLILDYTSHFHSDNKNHRKVLGLAIKILNDLKLNMKNNQILGTSYLVNSNNLFEKYALKALEKGLFSPVNKWGIPRKMGGFTLNGKEIIKSYIPDIIINYHNDTNTALAVLDVKNKDIYNPQDIGKLPDLYQILFYCYSLEATFGGLIYPFYGSLDATRININSFRESNLFVFIIDFSKPLIQRNRDFVTDVTKHFRIK